MTFFYDAQSVADRQLASGDGGCNVRHIYQTEQEKKMSSFNKAEQARKAAELTSHLAAAGHVAPTLTMPAIPVVRKKGPVDARGVELMVGDKVVRPQSSGHVPYLAFCEITKITSDGKVYLDNSPQALRFPNRVLVINDLQ